MGEGARNVVGQRGLDGQLGEDHRAGVGAVERLPEAADVGKLHEEARPLGMVDDDADELDDVVVRDALQSPELAHELRLLRATRVPLKVQPLGRERLAVVRDLVDRAKGARADLLAPDDPARHPLELRHREPSPLLARRLARRMDGVRAATGAAAAAVGGQWIDTGARIAGGVRVR